MLSLYSENVPFESIRTGRIAVMHMQFWAWAWLWKGGGFSAIRESRCRKFDGDHQYVSLPPTVEANSRPGSTQVQFWQTGSSFCLLPLQTSLVSEKSVKPSSQSRGVLMHYDALTCTDHVFQFVSGGDAVFVQIVPHFQGLV